MKLGSYPSSARWPTRKLTLDDSVKILDIDDFESQDSLTQLKIDLKASTRSLIEDARYLMDSDQLKSSGYTTSVNLAAFIDKARDVSVKAKACEDGFRSCSGKGKNC